MKKLLTAVKFSAVMACFAFVYVIFYIVNKYYADSLLEWKRWLFLALTALTLFVIFRFINKKRGGIDLKILALGFLILPLALAGYEFLSYQYAYVEGGSIVREGTRIYFLAEPESTEGKDVIFQQDLIVPRFDFVKQQLPENMHEYFKRVSLVKAMASVEKFMLINAAGAAAYFLLFYGLGAAVFFRKKQLDAADRSMSFFLGAALFSLPIFLLGVLKLYSAGAFLALAALVLVFSYGRIADFLKYFFTEKIKFDRWKSLAIFSVIYLFLGMLMIDIVRVIPIAWDDSNLYMRGAKLFAQINAFTYGIGPTSWTLLQSVGWLFYDKPQLSLTLLFATLITGMTIFHAIAEKFLSRSNAFIADFFFLSIPMMTFFSVLDTKTELPLLFAGAASLLAWLKWREKKEKRYLIVWSVLLAFALSIKITAIILAVIMVLATIYLETSFAYLVAALFAFTLSYFALTNQMPTLVSFKVSPLPLGYALLAAGIVLSAYSAFKEKFYLHLKKFAPLGWVAAATIAMLLPWIILNAYHGLAVLTELGYRDQFHTFSDSLFGLKKNGDFLPVYYTGQDICVTSDLAFTADYKRYTGSGNGLLALLLFPFTATMTLSLKTFITDMTPVFLSILPLWLLFPKKLFAAHKKMLFLFVATFAYVIIWALTSSGVAWYGIFMLIPGSILVVHTLKQKEKWWRYPLIFFIGFTLFANTFIRTKTFAELFHLSYAFGIKTEAEIVSAFYPGFAYVADRLMQYSKENAKVKIYRVGSQVRYFLPFEDIDIMDDDFLDQFTCIALGRTDEEIKQAFEQSGFTHIFINTNAGLLDEVNSGIYKEKINSLRSFLNGSGWTLLYDANNIQLYEIPL